jgi:hypothetical protein
LWPKPWAVQAFADASAVEHQMLLALVAMPLDARRQAASRGIQEHLDAVRHATAREGGLGKRGPLDWWRGASIECAYQHLHAAKVLLINLLPPEEIDALAPYVVARATTALNSGDRRRIEIEKLLQLPTSRAKRANLCQAMRFAYETSDQLYVRVRRFRNILISSATLILLLMVGLVLLVASHPTAMPLCFKPSSAVQAPGAVALLPSTTTPTSPSQQLHAAVRSVCPSGEDQGPTSHDVVIVAGLGLLGGALATAVAIRKVHGTATPYDVPMALGLLKIPTGSLTAVAGIVLLAGNVVPGLSALDSQPQILAYALALGYAQQAATRYVDDRAQTLLNQVPSKDSEIKNPESASLAPLTTPVSALSATDAAIVEPTPPRSSSRVTRALRATAQRLDDRRA